MKKTLLGIFISLAVFGIIVKIYTQTTILTELEQQSVFLRLFLKDSSLVKTSLNGKVHVHKANPQAREDIAIISIDESSIREFSDMNIQWPFPWHIHARVTSYLATGNPLAILYDIMFLNKKDGEDEFVKSLKKLGVGFLDYPFEVKYKSVATDIDERLSLLNSVRFPVDPADKNESLFESVVPPTPNLIKAAKGIGFANVFPDLDGISRTAPLVIKFNGWYYPNIDLITVMHYYGISPSDVEIKIGQYIKLKNIPFNKMAKPNKKREILIPINNYGFMDINFVGRSGSFQCYPYYLFANEGSLEGNKAVKDKILLIGAYSKTGIGYYEAKTPFGEMFGIEYHANVINAILNQDFIYELTSIYQCFDYVLTPFQNIFLMFFIAVSLAVLFQKFTFVGSTVSAIIILLFFSAFPIILFNYFLIITTFVVPLIQIVLTSLILIFSKRVGII